MPDRISIGFSFTSAQGVLRAINDCNRSLNDLATRLNAEVTRAGTWWEWESYDAYRDSYTRSSGGRNTILAIADCTASLSNRVISVAEKKKEWEQTGKKYF